MDREKYMRRALALAAEAAAEGEVPVGCIVTDRDGKVIERREPTSTQAIRPETAYTIRSMLQDAVRAGTGKPASLPKVTVFGKTGTSNEASAGAAMVAVMM